VSDVPLTVRSHKGPYTVRFDESALANLNGSVPENAHFIVDARIAGLYGKAMDSILAAPSVLRIEATEEAKSLDRFPLYVTHMVERGIRRDHLLIAIGGGVVQDITCFLAATLLRGVPWIFYPTTLLAQADSCIGSKSSINAGAVKNILGTFTPPREVFISTHFLDTLDERDVRSGVGEILKVHAIAGPEKFDSLAAEYGRLFDDRATMIRCIQAALAIKIPYVEDDEFDRGRRNVFNYGHSFGHAIEAATNFAVPHGIGVTMGMDLANFVAGRLQGGNAETYARMHPTLRTNYRGFEDYPIPLDAMLAALSKDKKNTGKNTATLILPDRSGGLAKVSQPLDAPFAEICVEYLETGRRR
jgi:3-dehydroquinate synthase